MKTLFIAGIFLLVFNSLNAQIYKGTIGKIPVFLNFESAATDTEVYGAYFYQSQGIDIRFEGTMKGNQLVFHAGSNFAEEKDQELFKLVKKGTGLTGTWLYKGKKLNVSLAKINPFSLPNMYTKNPFFAELTQENKELSRDGIEYIRTSLARFTPMDSVTKLSNGIQLKWYKESHWESILFRVQSGLPDATIKWLNDKLEALQLESFTSFGSCGSGGDEDGWHSALNDYFISADFCSLEIAYDYYCGGAHPDFGTEQVNLDLKKHLVLETEDLLQFPGVIHQNELNFTEWSDYRLEYAERLLSYLKKLYPEEFPDIDEESAEADETCNYDNPEVWEYSDLHITPKGFKVGAYFARYARSCDDPEWSYIPYELVKEFINPEYRKALLSVGK